MDRKEAMIALLRSTGAEYECFLASLPEKHAEERLHPEGWSVLQTAEHVVLAERAMLWMYRAGQAGAKSDEVSREEKFAAIMANREGRGKTPERAAPTGQIKTLSQALTEFSQARDATIRDVERDSRELATMACSHPMFGVVNGYEMLTLLAGHGSRHLAQIREIVGRKG